MHFFQSLVAKFLLRDSKRSGYLLCFHHHIFKHLAFCRSFFLFPKMIQILFIYFFQELVTLLKVRTSYCSPPFWFSRNAWIQAVWRRPEKYWTKISVQLLWFSLEGCHANWLWPFLLQRMPRKSLYVSGLCFGPSGFDVIKSISPL